MHLVRDADAEGAAREHRASRGVEEENESLRHKFHSTVLYGKLRQAVCRSTNW